MQIDDLIKALAAYSGFGWPIGRVRVRAGTAGVAFANAGFAFKAGYCGRAGQRRFPVRQDSAGASSLSPTLRDQAIDVRLEAPQLGMVAEGGRRRRAVERREVGGRSADLLFEMDPEMRRGGRVGRQEALAGAQPEGVQQAREPGSGQLGCGRHFQSSIGCGL